MFLLMSLLSVFALLLKLQIKYKGNFILKRKKERRKDDISEQICKCSVIFLSVIFLQDVCCSNISPSSTVVLNRWAAACFLSEFTSNLVFDAVSLVGSDFIDTKSKKKDKNTI